MEMEFRRNEQRYRFLKWGTQAFNGFSVIPPGIGIVHQVNLEYLAKGVFESDGVYFPDTLVGTDSHTTMINGLGIVGWGVGGIEAEAGMLGQPVYFLTPDVVGVHLTGDSAAGLDGDRPCAAHNGDASKGECRRANLSSFLAKGTAALHATDRATIANMAPEYGATMGFFPVDEKTLEYFAIYGPHVPNISRRSAITTPRRVCSASRVKAQVDYTTVIELILETVTPSVAGPKRPQDRIELSNLDDRFVELFTKSVSDGGYGKETEELEKRFMRYDGRFARAVASGRRRPKREIDPAAGAWQQVSDKNTNVMTEIEMINNRPTPDRVDIRDVQPSSRLRHTVGNGDVLIAAITSCTNTSNPSVMIAAGIVAKKAAERGMKVPDYVKTSLAPGSRVVTEYLEKTGLQEYLDEIGFQSGRIRLYDVYRKFRPARSTIEEEVVENDIIAASVLSGNRNFEARVHQNIKANFLMSPPLVVAFALAGTVVKDVYLIRSGRTGTETTFFLRISGPSLDEVKEHSADGL